MWAFRPANRAWWRSLRIELTRSGGFGGLETKLGELDTSELPEEEVRELERLVEQANLPELTAASPLRGEGADRFQYHLTIEDEQGRRELTAAEDRVPDALRGLLERVSRSGGA